jgi:hypothetical protein
MWIAVTCYECDAWLGMYDVSGLLWNDQLENAVLNHGEKGCVVP